MKWVFCVLFCLLLGSLFASVQVRISDPNTLEPINLPQVQIIDPNTSELIDFPDVMVGSRISFVVCADANDFWSGGLFIKGQDRALGSLHAKDKDPNSRDWAGSHLTASGEGAYVLGWKDSSLWGFDLYPDDFDRQSGKWFAVDYEALEEGLCHVGFYDHNYSWDVPDPNVSFVFKNTPTRDLYPDGFVNFADFSIFSSCWQDENCNDPNAGCYRADLNRDGYVELEDVIMFAAYWLHGNPGWTAAEPSTTTEPNVIYDVTYAIVDVNSLSEINLEVGQSVEFYIVKSSTYEDVHIFSAEVNISDPNLGWIDNDSNTAQILAAPRMDDFDMISPGSNQIEGIEFFAVNINPSILDGDMASFVYTATQKGDVTLHLINYATAPACRLETITIHQTEPIAEQLEKIYLESPELQTEIPEPEWNKFIESVRQSE